MGSSDKDSHIDQPTFYKLSSTKDGRLNNHVQSSPKTKQEEAEDPDD